MWRLTSHQVLHFSEYIADLDMFSEALYVHILMKPVLDANTCASVSVPVKAPPLHLLFVIQRLLETL